MNKLFSYRSDIDGLRAISVVLVVLFHANFSWITGGFIGVDVFFVISGFLITYTINGEITQNKFSFRNFYLRRIRRIIPVLFFILLVCAIPAYLMFAADFETFSRTLLHTILSTNNIYLWANNRQYFSENSELIPLLHTWSLSIEEQFYFIWPSLLILLHKVKTSQNKAILISLFVITGLFTSVYLSETDQNSAYFLLPARIFEMGIGAAIAIFWNSFPSFKKKTNDFLSITGLLLIVIPAFTLNKASIFPGFNALWPCIGTALLLLSNKENDSNAGVVNTILKNKFLVSIGLISYSMYLWHWPIFSFLQYFGLSLTGYLRILSIIVIFILSYLSWRFIEQPFRTTFVFNFKKTILYIMLPVFAISGILYGIIDQKDGFPERFPNLSEFNPKKNYPNKIRKECFDKFKIGNCDDCFLGIKKDSLDGVLIGDSYANHTAAFLDVLAKDAGLYLHDSAAGGYALLVNVDDNNVPLKDEKYGIDRLEYAKKFKTIFIASNWDNISQSKVNCERVTKTIAKLLSLNKNIVIFDCLNRMPETKLHKLQLTKAYPEYFYESFIFDAEKRTKHYLVYELKRKFPSITVIDLNETVKVGRYFTTTINKSIVYRNADHLNTSGARQMGKKYLLLHKNPLKNL
jgi:peptidoglycan/LPS O-acetylase OafA/YrhL